jgi:signal transduction histidine kinase
VTVPGANASSNAVFGLLLTLTRAPSPARAMRLVTTAVPSIAPGHTAVAWHPSTSGGYYERAPQPAGRALARLTGPGRLAVDARDRDGAVARWAFPLTAEPGREPVFLVTTGPRDLSGQEALLLSVLSQTCGMVVANRELTAAAEQRDQAASERVAAQRELMASRARIVAASDAARQRVTRDLHDGTQQWFVTALINLQLAEQKWESAPQRARELLALGVSDARNGVDDLREIAAGLHPAVLTRHGLGVALGSLATRLPLPVDVDVPDRRLPDRVEASVYFFCSEALTNVVKHAQASQAWVRIRLGDGQCTVEVRDDGTGGARPRSESSGLTGLRDRIGTLGGTVEILSPGPGGTVLRAAIPLPG